MSKDFINPYKSVFGGDFDVTVLIQALKGLSMDVKWLKKDEDANLYFGKENFIGFLVNSEIKKGKSLSKFLGQSGRHWTCIKKHMDKYVHLDSLES